MYSNYIVHKFIDYLIYYNYVLADLRSLYPWDTWFSYVRQIACVYYKIWKLFEKWWLKIFLTIDGTDLCKAISLSECWLKPWFALILYLDLLFTIFWCSFPGVTVFSSIIRFCLFTICSRLIHFSVQTRGNLFCFSIASNLKWLMTVSVKLIVNIYNIVLQSSKFSHDPITLARHRKSNEA